MIALDVMVYPGSTPDPGPADSPYAPAQKAWLEADLAAVNRSQTPWILAFAHHPLYCSSTTMGAGTSESAEGEATVLFDSARGGPEPGELTDAQKARIPKGKGYAGCLGTGVVGVEARADLEPILEAHGVDMFLAGHEHDYESIWPVKDCAIGSKNCYIGTSFDSPKATVHVVCGEGGEGDLPPSAPPPLLRARARTHTHTHTHTHTCRRRPITHSRLSTLPRRHERRRSFWIKLGSVDAQAAGTGYARRVHDAVVGWANARRVLCWVRQNHGSQRVASHVRVRPERQRNGVGHVHHSPAQPRPVPTVMRCDAFTRHSVTVSPSEGMCM
jgi:hypothetical protein